jgi:Fe-S cluster biogenesis protein NfuA
MQSVQATNVGTGNDALVFLTVDGEMFVFKHAYECCEFVSIEDIAGDLQDLVGSPILMAEAVTYGSTSDLSDENKRICQELLTHNKTEVQDSGTWTFYKFATSKGHVDVRWVGVTSGCYSLEVDFCKVLHELYGKTISKVWRGDQGNSITFVTSDGKQYKSYHPKYIIYPIFGNSDLQKLVGSVIERAEEAHYKDITFWLSHYTAKDLTARVGINQRFKIKGHYIDIQWVSIENTLDHLYFEKIA